MSTTPKRFATRTFRDAGTGKRFLAGKPIEDVSEAELANYEAAGLAGDQPRAAATKPADTKAPSA